jgi:hypothetical protein
MRQKSAETEAVKVDDYREAIRKLIEDDIRNDVEEEMRKAADELLAARRQAIKQVLE